MMIWKLPIALAEAKGGNLSEDLINEIWWIVHSLHPA